MAQDHLKTLFKYVRDVLGVESFAQATSSQIPPQMPTVVRSKPYLFISDRSDSSSIEMQQRMVTALKLKVDDVDFINVDQTKVESSELLSARVVVVFGQETQKALQIGSLAIGEQRLTGITKILVTHSLSELASSPNSKKETWTHLQSAF